jgi:hypothetical protein
MATTTYDYDEKGVLEIEATGSIIESVAGLAVIVLAIIGLTRSDSRFIASIAAIVLGFALLAKGGAITAEYSKLLSMISGGAVGAVEFGGGTTVEMLAGGGMAVLGVLGSLGFAPVILVSAGVIEIGIAIIFASNGSQRLSALKVRAAGFSELAEKVAEGTVTCAATTQVLAGGAAAVLGILALTTTAHAETLMLVGLLVLGAAVAMSGTALTGRILRLFNIDD